MSRSSLSWPLAILAGFAVFMVLLIAGALDPTPAQLAVTNACPTTSPQYPGCNRTAEAETVERQGTAAQQTADAQDTFEAQTQQAIGTACAIDSNAYPSCNITPTQDNGNTGGGNNTGGDNQQQPTSTFTPTATNTTGAAATPTLSQGADQGGTAAATSTLPADEVDPSISALPTATTLLPAGVETLSCIPGTTVDLDGTAPPNTALLLFFNDRPVGGGLSSAAGTYRLRLQVGDERPGLYVVEVRERGSRALVDQFGCEVPPFTPTPTTVR